jgi:RNA polymerase primary sigma factor
MDNESLVKLYQEGNKQALDELVENNKGIVYKIANKYYTEKTNSIDVDDLIQEGYLGLMAAAKKYNPDHAKRAQFVTYAIYLIDWRIKRFIITRNTNEETSLNIPIADDDDRQLEDCIKWPYNQYEALEERLDRMQLRRELEKVMYEQITLREREIIKFHYGWDNNNCMIYDELCELFNLSEPEVKTMNSRALRKMRSSTWCRMKRNERREYMNVERKAKASENIKTFINNIELLKLKAN